MITFIETKKFKFGDIWRLLTKILWLLLFLFSFNLVVFADDDIRNKINQISVFDNKIPEDVPFVEKFQGGHPKLWTMLLFSQELLI